MWPQIVFLMLMALGTGSTVAQHKDVGLTLVANALTLWLLYMGGFWAPIGL